MKHGNILLVYLKKTAGLNTKDFKTGQTVLITGIISRTATGIRLLPRFQDDIVLKGESYNIEPQVLGEAIGTDNWSVDPRDKKGELFKYLLIIAAGAIIILAGLFIKATRNK